MSYPDVKTTEGRIQAGLFWQYQDSSRLLVPNYTPKGWWECDVLRVLKSGFTAEFEIKLTPSDFRKDFEKTASYGWGKRCQAYDGAVKHELLAKGTGACPNYFWFAMTPQLYGKVKDEIPDYAGVVLAQARGATWMSLNVAKKAPRLHPRKSEEDWEQMLFKTFYWRLWKLKDKTEKASQKQMFKEAQKS